MIYLPNDTAIIIDDLKKSFDEVKALKGISATINKGTIVGLIGPNGAGKSTLIRLLCGIMKPTSGQAQLYGFNLLSQKTEVKRITGLLPEEYALYEKLTVKEYTQFISSLYDISDSDYTSRFDEYMQKLEIEHLKDRIIETLSKGQKQKVAFITALIPEPLVLFLDEPLANLDIKAQVTVREIIKEYKANNRVIVVATHLIENIITICDDIILIDQGKVVFNGSLSSFQDDFGSFETAYLGRLGV